MRNIKGSTLESDNMLRNGAVSANTYLIPCRYEMYGHFSKCSPSIEANQMK